MTDSPAKKKSSTTHGIKTLPYAPSWIDRLTGWIDKLPGSAWIYYIGLAALLLVLQASFIWAEGGFSIETFSIVHLYISIAIAAFFALTNFLDDRAEKAFEAMQNVLNVSDKKFAELEYRLTNLPSGMTILASLITVGGIYTAELIGGQYRLAELEGLPVSATLIRVIYYIGFWIMGTYFYHAIHQLRMVDEIYTKYTHVNLFRIKPLYAFSNLSAFTSGSIAVIVYGWMLVNPDMEVNAPGIVINIIIFLLVLVTFLWPQLGIHSLQVREKDRLIEEANQRFEKIMLEIHQSVDGGKLGRMAELNMAIMTLEIELNNLNKINTWPWQPETLRWLITALVLPLGLWLIQFVLQRVLGS